MGSKVRAFLEWSELLGLCFGISGCCLFSHGFVVLIKIVVLLHCLYNILRILHIMLITIICCKQKWVVNIGCFLEWAELLGFCFCMLGCCLFSHGFIVSIEIVDWLHMSYNNFLKSSCYLYRSVLSHSSVALQKWVAEIGWFLRWTKLLGYLFSVFRVFVFSLIGSCIDQNWGLPAHVIQQSGWVFLLPLAIALLHYTVMGCLRWVFSWVNEAVGFCVPYLRTLSFFSWFCCVDWNWGLTTHTIEQFAQVFLLPVERSSQFISCMHNEYPK